MLYRILTVNEVSEMYVEADDFAEAVRAADIAVGLKEVAAIRPATAQELAQLAASSRK